MKHIRQLFFIGLLLGCFGVLMETASATTRVPIAANGRASMSISNHDYTRIFVLGDRIKTVRGMKGQYQLKQDNHLGDIYLLPAKIKRTAPINVYITTESGQTFQLRLSPKKILANSVALMPLTHIIKQTDDLAKETAYTKKLLTILKAAIQHQVLDGFTALPLAHSPDVRRLQGLKIVPVWMMQSGGLQAWIYAISNTSKKPAMLNEVAFFQSHTLALALDAHFIKAKGQTLLFEVSTRD